MKIATKLSLGFGIVLALMLTVSLTGFSALRTYNQEVDTVLNRENVKTANMQIVNEAAGDSMNLTLKALLVSTPEAWNKIFAEMDATRETFNKAMEKFESLTYTEKGKLLTAEAKKQTAAFAAVRNDIKELILTGKHDEAVAMMDRLFESRKSFDASIETLIQAPG